MNIWQVAEGLLGVLIVLGMASDVFLTVVVPRRAPRTGGRLRLSRYLVSRLWGGWRWLGLHIGSADRREGFLGSFAPLAIILLLLGWVAGLVVGFGLLFDAMRSELKPEPENLGSTMYFAGTTLLTLGFGDFVPSSGPARLTALVAAASGLGTF